jgi:hypothetical protein
MRQRILGLGGGRLRRRFLLAAVASLAALGALLISNAGAVHDLGLFELDRNAQDAATPGDDWSTLYDGGSNSGGNSSVFTGILPDVSPPGAGDQFQGGGSKDDLDVDQWLWKPGEPLDKDDITNAYAAAYVNTTDTGANNVGDNIIYFGLDRLDNSGSAQVGFWFFQNDISLTNDPAGGGFRFSGVHSVGDVLIQRPFSQGGVIDSVSVYEWDPTAPATSGSSPPRRTAQRPCWATIRPARR